MDPQPAPSAGPISATLESPRSFDYLYTQDDGIKESFLIFSLKINDLDKQLGGFANACSKLGRVAGLLLAIKKTREMIRRTREVFFRNATALLPNLYEIARRDRNLALRDSAAEHYFISQQYFENPIPPFDVLPTVLEELAHAFSLLHVRIAEFREFTDEGLLLKSLLLTMENDLMYRASCVRVYSGRLNTPPIQRYVHQLTDELQSEFERLTNAFCEFTDVGVSAISNEQERSSQSLANILTASTFFSGVTAGTLSMSVGNSNQNTTLQVSSMLWFGSLVFSVGAALNSLLAMAWNETRSGSRGGKLPFWVTMWIDGSQLLFLGISIVTFSAGLVVFAFSSEQAFYTPYVTVAAIAVTFIGLTAIMIWMVYEIIVSPVLVQQAEVIKSSRETIHSDVSKLPAFADGIAGALSNALFSLRTQPYRGSGDQVDTDIESMDEKTIAADESTKEEKEPGKLKAMFRGHVRDIGVLSNAAAAFISAGDSQRRKRFNAPKKLQIDTSVPSAPLTQLNLPSQPFKTFKFARYGIIRDVAYSEDGHWLAVTCAKENTLQSWTTVIDAQSFETFADVWHEGRVISERLIWSPSSTKLLVKFEHRFDVWDIDAKSLYSIERDHCIQDVKWCGEEAFLVAEHNCVFKLNSARLMAVYRFEHMQVRSIGLERRNNYLIVITRVARSPDQFEPASSRSEKRIVVYDMDKQQAIYQVPVLENIFRIQPIANELDILVTHKDQKAFQLWSLDAGLKGSEITARLKKRTITPQANPSDYVGPTCIAGNYSQFILSVTSSGALDIWRRDSGAPHQRFESQILQEEGVSCFSWRKTTDNAATFATAGAGGDTLRIWRGEEAIITKTPTSLDPVHTSDSRGRNRWQNVMGLVATSSSGSMPPFDAAPGTEDT